MNPSTTIENTTIEITPDENTVVISLSNDKTLLKYLRYKIHNNDNTIDQYIIDYVTKIKPGDSEDIEKPLTPEEFKKTFLHSFYPFKEKKPREKVDQKNLTSQEFYQRYKPIYKRYYEKHKEELKAKREEKKLFKKFQEKVLII